MRDPVSRHEVHKWQEDWYKASNLERTVVGMVKTVENQ